MESLVRRRGALKAKLTRFKIFLDKLKGAIDQSQEIPLKENIVLKTRLQTIRPLLSEFEEIHLQLPEGEDALFELEEFESSYFDIVSEAESLLSQPCLINAETQNRPNSPTPSVSSSRGGLHETSVKLPTINLPRFAGEFENWLEFKEMFLALIHENPSLTDIQKLHYLRGSLQSNAADLIKSLEFSAKNYKIAWDSVCQRFDNPLLLIRNHLTAIFSLEVIKEESSVKLLKFRDTLFKHDAALKSLAPEQNLYDSFLIYLVSSKLDPATLRSWESYRSKQGSELPTLLDFKSFLKEAAELVETLESKSLKSYSKTTKSQRASFVVQNKSEPHSLTCAACKKQHSIYNCPEFLKLSPPERLLKVKDLKVCINCLSKSHFASRCSSTFTCKQCKRKHHTLLHDESRKQEEDVLPSHDTNASQLSSPATTHNSSISTFCGNTNYVLLPTAMAKLTDGSGNSHSVRILLDSGSQSNFIRTDLCSKLKLPIENANTIVTGFGANSTNITHKCKITLYAHTSAFFLETSCLLVNDITGSMPAYSIDRELLKIPSHIRLSDVHFDKSGHIDILLGASVFWNLLCNAQIRLGPNLPTLHKTHFGWIVSGSTGSSVQHRVNCNVVKCEDDVDHLLTKFWEVESCPDSNQFSKEDYCEKHFKENTIRNSDGRFVVKIPLVKSIELLGDSFEIAKKRFFNLERKLHRNIEFAQRYSSFMKEYEDLGHMVVASSDTPVSYYLPHHGVMREESLTTKLRVVFNGSAETTSGESLNNIQAVGPTVQQDLFSILVRFRTYLYAITADIEKMYRQVLIHPSQRCLQRILWRSSPSDPLQVYELQTVTYGTASAPFLAIRCVFQLGVECENSNPDLARVIKNDMYVDDILTGANSLSEAQSLCLSLIKVMDSGCFKLRKWTSNDPEVLTQISDAHKHPGSLKIGSPDNCSTTLGLLWSFQSDTFQYSIHESSSQSITKRLILSEISRIFDPLGFLAPCIMTAKILLQKLWLEKLSWDDPVPAHVQKVWRTLRIELQQLNEIQVPRYVFNKLPSQIEIHGFADASMNGYAACIYLRSFDGHKYYSSLLCAKSKVGPLKTLTIPKLELCAATLLAKLTHQVSKIINVPVSRCLLWTDSSIVIGWLKAVPSTFKLFVSNRIVQIHEFCPDAIWRHVNTEFNPADLPSRGVTPNKLKESLLWWHGPPWLREPEVCWPPSKFKSVNLPELKQETKSFVFTDCNSFPFQKYSNLTFLERTVAYCFRFASNCSKKREDRLTGSLSPFELNFALLALIKMSQIQSFPNEIKLLNQNQQIIKSSPLIKLNPFLDKNEFLRVGGRIQYSHFPYDKRHPLLISNKHPIAKLIASRAHVRLLHAGPQFLLASLREKFWILSGRNLVRQVVHKCMQCFKVSPKSLQPIMGQLPSARTKPAPPFYTVGIDYAGPLMIKDRKGRGSKTTKGYLCLFVCFVTKACHLELVTDMSMETFILAFRRFVARRGKPSQVYSDNGTNFVGANSQLRELGQTLKVHGNTIVDTFANEGIQWHFIPPRSPHFGGLWEAAIKSCKNHLRRVLGINLLTYEELSSLLIQIEACLNSRPLSPLSTDPNDLNPLTPAHFLVGRSLVSLPDPDVTNLPMSRLSIFQRIQHLYQSYWRRWSKEYIAELIQRQKWAAHHSHLQLGSLVLIKEDSLPPLRWKLGRVVEVHSGPDRVNRVASIRTSSGIIKRSSSKLCPLPMDS